MSVGYSGRLSGTYEAADAAADAELEPLDEGEVAVEAGAELVNVTPYHTYNVNPQSKVIQ